MRNIFKLLALSLILMFLPIKTYAQGSTVEIKLNGEVKNNRTIDIVVNINDVESLYAGSIDFKYDSKILKIESIESSNFIKDDKLNVMEFNQEIYQDDNRATYYFTCVGNEAAIKGSGTFVTIKAKVLKANKLSIGKDDMNIKLVEKTNKDEIKELEYTFKGYNIKSGGENKTSKTNINQGDIEANAISIESSNQESEGTNEGNLEDNNKVSEDKNDVSFKNEDKNYINNKTLDSKEKEVTVSRDDKQNKNEENLNVSEDIGQNTVVESIQSSNSYLLVAIISIIVIIVVYILYKNKYKK